MPIAHGASGGLRAARWALIFSAVQYGAIPLELSAIKPENSRKIVPLNFIFFGTNHGTHRPEENFQESLDAISRFAVKGGSADDVCAPVHATNCWKFPKVTRAPK